MIADRLTDAGIGELWFYHRNGKGDSLLHTAKVNLLSSSTMTQLTKRMTTHAADIPWTEILTLITATTLAYERRGDVGEVLSPEPGTVIHPGYYIDPLLIKGLPTILHGEKGTHKSTLGLLALGLIAEGIQGGLAGLVAQEQAKVGVLDWENDRQTTLYTAGRLISGGAPYFKFAYRRCALALADDINRIAEFVHDQQLQVILIDSLGQAAGSDQFDSAGKRAALRFFESLRLLGVTSLIIAQEAKTDEGKKSIYGSVYYSYYARSVFELRSKRDEMNPAISHLGLFHTDANYSQLHEPMGFTVTHSPESITIESEHLKLSDFLEKVSQTKQLLELLADGAKTRSTIAKFIGVSDKHADVLLSRLKKRGLVVSLGQSMWGLLSQENDPNS